MTETLTIAQLRDRWTESQFQAHVLNLARSLGLASHRKACATKGAA